MKKFLQYLRKIEEKTAAFFFLLVGLSTLAAYYFIKYSIAAGMENLLIFGGLLLAWLLFGFFVVTGVGMEDEERRIYERTVNDVTFGTDRKK